MEDHKSKDWKDSLGGDAEGAKVIWELVGDYATTSSVDVDAGWKALSSKLDASSPRRSRKPTPGRVMYWFTAAAAAALVLFFINTFSDGETDIEQYANQSTSLRSFELADNTSVQLYPGASVRFSSSENQRSAALSGKAFFAVASDKSRPFTVEGKGFELVVVGTQFEVEAAERSSVAVTEGHVRLRGKRESDWVDLYAGYSAEVVNQEVVTTSSPSKKRSDELVFESISLGKVSAYLKENGILSLEIPSALVNCPVSADFTVSSVQEITESLAVLFSASIKKKGVSQYVLVGGSCK